MDHHRWQRIGDEVKRLSVHELMDESLRWLEHNRDDRDHSDGAIVQQERELDRLRKTMERLDQADVSTDDIRYKAIAERLAGFCIVCRASNQGRRPGIPLT